MTDKIPVGQRFSHVYLKRGEPGADSVRMRRRIAALVYSFPDLSDVSGDVPLALGIDVPWGMGGVDWAKFFSTVALQDVLDFTTIAFSRLEKMRKGGMRNPYASDEWCKGVGLIFSEENLHYSVDDHGGVHFAFDAEFARNSVATVSGISACETDLAA